jgi:hypothetical protein
MRKEEDRDKKNTKLMKMNEREKVASNSSNVWLNSSEVSEKLREEMHRWEKQQHPRISIHQLLTHALVFLR